MPRRTPAETRELMLRAAVDVIRQRSQQSGDDALAAALAHLKLTQVAERATEIVREETGDQKAKAITTGAIYQQWSTQGEFQVDLLFHIAGLHATRLPDLPASRRRYQEAFTQGVPFEEALRQVMERAYRRSRENPLFRVQLGFLIAAADPRLRAALAHGQSLFAAAADQALEALLEAYQRRVRPPFTVHDLAAAVDAQLTGSCILWFADPDLLADPAGDQDWSLPTRIINAIVDGYTEPA